tara:strand:+ start:165 stop:605 length:441 start_codon:yes stop_codon:yes gene_type:complete
LNKKIAYFIVFLTAFLSSCGGEQKRNADIVVTYDGKVVYENFPKYNTENDLRRELKNQKGPDFIVFSATWCASCRQLEQIIEDLGWRGNVLLLNIDQRWVSFIAKHMQIAKVPALVVSTDKGKGNFPIIYGSGEISMKIYTQFGVK